MSNVIQFLESVGRAPLSAAEYAATVASLDVEAMQKQALLNCDHAALNGLLGGRGKVFFGVFAAEEDDEQTPAELAA